METHDGDISYCFDKQFWIYLGCNANVLNMGPMGCNVLFVLGHPQNAFPENTHTHTLTYTHNAIVRCNLMMVLVLSAC